MVYLIVYVCIYLQIVQGDEVCSVHVSFKWSYITRSMAGEYPKRICTI